MIENIEFAIEIGNAQYYGSKANWRNREFEHSMVITETVDFNGETLTAEFQSDDSGDMCLYEENSDPMLIIISANYKTSPSDDLVDYILEELSDHTDAILTKNDLAKLYDCYEQAEEAMRESYQDVVEELGLSDDEEDYSFDGEYRYIPKKLLINNNL